MNKRRYAIRGLLFVILIDYLGVGIIFVIAPMIFISSGSPLHVAYRNPAELKLFFCLFLAMYPVGQFFSASTLGRLSDEYGRRKILLTTIAGTFLGYLILMAGLLSHAVVLLIGGRLLSGLFAGNVAVAQAGIIDLSKPQSKAKNISLIQSVIGVAWIFGTPLGGLLYGRMTQPFLKYSTPVLLVLLLILAMFTAVYFFYKETRIGLKDQSSNMQQQMTRTRLSPSIHMLLFIWFLFILAQWVFEALMPAYFVEKYSYSGLHVGIVLGSMGLTYALVQLLVVKLLANRVNRENFIMGSLFVAAASLMCFMTSYGYLQMYASLLFYVVSMAFILSYYTTLISNQVDEARQGEVMGKLSSLQAVAAIVAMLLGGGINIFNNTYPILFAFFAFLLSALLFMGNRFFISKRLVV